MKNTGKKKNLFFLRRYYSFHSKLLHYLLYNYYTIIHRQIYTFIIIVPANYKKRENLSCWPDLSYSVPLEGAIERELKD